MKQSFTLILIIISGLACAQDTLKLVSWNLHLLPSPVFAKSKKKTRTDSIVNYFTKIDTSINLLLFQEVFHAKRRNQLIAGLENLYPYHTPIVNSAKKRLLKTNSGLIVFSKTPIIQMDAIKYNDCSGSDCMAFKGAQFIHTVWNNTPLLVVNTHLNSEPPRSIALEQAKMIINELIPNYIEKEIPIFIGGDFNINCSDSSNYDKLLQIVKTNNSSHIDCTDISSPKVLESTLDYIFLYDDWLPEYLKLEQNCKFQIGPSWIDSDDKKIYGKTVGFSDHHPVLMKLSFQK
ncbi:MAG: hypothetical protein H6599_09310 [Flavobacteriales bacterium]|nr:hypothetical protein [Flavobacteriales bacterium]